MTEPTGYTAVGMVGFTDKGTYSASASYVKNDLAHYGGNIWRCLIDDTTGITPTEGTNWTLFVGEPTNMAERMIAPLEVSPSANAYSVGEQLIFNDTLYTVTTAIAIGDALTVGTNITASDKITSQIQTLTNQVGNNTSNFSLVRLRQYFDDLIMQSLAYEENDGVATRAYKVGDIVFKRLGITSESPNWSLVKVTSAIPQGGTFTIGSNCKVINHQMIPTGYSRVSSGYNNVVIDHMETIGGVHQIRIQGELQNEFTALGQHIIGLKSVAEAIKLPDFIGCVEFNGDTACKLYYDDTYLYLSPATTLPVGHMIYIYFTWIEE